jgi:uncharacterized RDD family membrane protein YckC
LVQPAEEQTQTRCVDCGARLQCDVRFCADCGAPVQAVGGFAVWLKARPSLPRRMQAELIDRFAPLVLSPVIALPLALVSLRCYFWFSEIAILAWHLLRDCSPQRRSFGKWRRKLRVVTAGKQRQCRWWQALLRRVLPTLSQASYTLAAATLLADFTGWETLKQTIALPWPQWAASGDFVSRLLLLPLIYDLVSLAAIAISPEARRLEDYLCGTQVILEDAYVRDRESCVKCGHLTPHAAIFCPNCGEPKTLKII